MLIINEVRVSHWHTDLTCRRMTSKVDTSPSANSHRSSGASAGPVLWGGPPASPQGALVSADSRAARDHASLFAIT